MNTALTRRESLWADEPVMRDGRVLDLAHKAICSAVGAQSALVAAITSPKPRAWLEDAEREAGRVLDHIRSMRAVLK